MNIKFKIVHLVSKVAWGYFLRRQKWMKHDLDCKDLWQLIYLHYPRAPVIYLLYLLTGVLNIFSFTSSKTNANMYICSHKNIVLHKLHSTEWLGLFGYLGVIGLVAAKTSTKDAKQPPQPKTRKPDVSKADIMDHQLTTIEVSEISSQTSEDFLRRYFESERRSGGGEILQMNYDQCTGTAIITFKSSIGLFSTYLLCWMVNNWMIKWR